MKPGTDTPASQRHERRDAPLLNPSQAMQATKERIKRNLFARLRLENAPKPEGKSQQHHQA
jgi:hypothetical protein